MQYIKFENFINSTQYGYTAETTSPISGDAKYLRITDIVPYFVEKDRVPYCAIDASKVNKYLVHDGDVLIARTGATTGYNLVVDDSFKNYVFASYLIRFNYDRKKLHPRYLKYVLKSPSWYGFVNNYIGGSAQPGMNARVFGKYYLPYTDFSTQQKIASILSAYDSLIENNKKRIKLLEQMAENLYKEWFVRFRFPGYETAEFEGGVPKGWRIEKLGNVANIRTGKCNREDAEEGGIFPLFDRSQEVKKSNTWLMDCEAIIVPGEGTSFTPRYYEGKFNLHQRCYCVAPRQKGTGKFLFYMLMFNKAYFLSVATGATVPSLRQNNFTKMKFIMPSFDLCRQYDKHISLFFAEIESLSKQVETLTHQRDLLLPRLMSGKLSI